jgi:predicted glycoside hydrolase/deacetylase ChbG (UPF0249 family)
MNSIGRILITADDANVNSCIDRAILELTDLGVVTNVAVFANTDGDFDVSQCLKNKVSISIHLNITHGSPICKTDSVSTLVNPEGIFFSPKDIFDLNNCSLQDAILLYQSEVLPAMNQEQILRELRAQVEAFTIHFGKLPVFNSFHQDLDKDHHLYKLADIDSTIPRTRAHLIKSGELSGFYYRLFDELAPLSSYVSDVQDMLLEAISVSAKNKGAPFEVALHPSSGIAQLDQFTAYRAQRVYEFEAWRSESVVSLIKLGRREGAIVEFPVDTKGNVV